MIMNPSTFSRSAGGCVLALAMFHVACTTSSATGTIRQTESFSTPATEKTGTAASALLASGQQTMLSDGSHNFTETYAFAYRNGGPGSPSELFTLANNVRGDKSGWDLTSWTYGCTQNSQTAITRFTLSGFTDNGGDNSGFYDDSAHQVTAVNILSNGRGGSGVRIFASSNPCPSTGGSSWAVTTWNTASDNSVDYPFTNVDFVHHKSFVTWRQNKSNGHRGMFISHIPVGTMYSSNCPKIDQKDIEDINFTFDLSGNVHLVYANVTDQTIEHEMFDPISNQFACENEVIGGFSYVSAFPPCAQCSATTTYPGLQYNCRRVSTGLVPTIASDSLTAGTSNLVVTYATPGTGGCQNMYETRMYLSTDLGRSWTWKTVTGCQISIEPRVTLAADGFAGFYDVFHIVSDYVPPGDNRFVEADWRSADQGQSWSGTQLTAPRETGTTLGACQWGDYNGIAADVTNARMFFTWGEKKPSAAFWSAEGISNPL